MKKVIMFSLVFLIIFSLSFFYYLDKQTAGAASFLRNKILVASQDGEEGGYEELKTETCPLNKSLQTKTNRTLWEQRRPLGVMVENSVDARPQSGLSNADIVFEAVAEGGITRFLSIFYCQDAEILGPVRSARVYFVDLIAGFGNDPLYAHVGGANTPGPANALGQIEDEGWAGYNDLDQFSIGFPAFWRDYERLKGVAVEHTMYTNTEKVWEIAAKRGLTEKDKKGKRWDTGFSYWKFKDDLILVKRPESKTIKFGFWEDYTNFTVSWVYNKNKNAFVRFYGKTPHIDKNTKKALETKNVVVLFMEESVANDGYEKGQHLLYSTIGGGEAIVFQNGEKVAATWSKEDRYSQLILVDNNDKEIEFVKGTVWFEVLPSDNKVSFK